MTADKKAASVPTLKNNTLRDAAQQLTRKQMANKQPNVKSNVEAIQICLNWLRDANGAKYFRDVQGVSQQCDTF